MAALSINFQFVICEWPWKKPVRTTNMGVRVVQWYIASICSVISFELIVELYSHNYSSSQLTTMSSTQWYSWPTRDQVYSALPCWTLLCIETLSVMHRTLLEKYLGSEIDKNTRVSHHNSWCPQRSACYKTDLQSKDNSWSLCDQIV